MAPVLETAEKLVTAEEYLRMREDHRYTELVAGEIVEMCRPGFRHGVVCGNIHWVLRRFLEERPLGRLVTNDAGIVTRRDPDTVRGADVAFYSFHRLPQDAEPEGYPAVAPELVFEVLSPEDRWPTVQKKVAEYLEAGVIAVCVVDPLSRVVNVFHAQAPVEERKETDELRLPEILVEEFAVEVRRFFGPG